MSAANSEPVASGQSTVDRPQPTVDRPPVTGHRSPPVCALRSFQVYELPGTIEVHFTADHGQTIAWAMPPRMAAALGAKLRFHGSHATNQPRHPAGGSL